MTKATETLAQLKKASKLTRLTFRAKGPKSFKRGQGALLKALAETDELTQKELVKILGCDRSHLKDIVKKAERNGFVQIVDTDKKKTYIVKLTEEGKALARKRIAANDKVAEEILSCLTEEEIASLDAITEKLILAAKEAGTDGKKKGRKMHHHHKMMAKDCRKHGKKGHGHRHGHRHGHGHCCHR